MYRRDVHKAAALSAAIARCKVAATAPARVYVDAEAERLARAAFAR